MRDPRIEFKIPWLAALLAFLVPGAGHLYQGRYLKAAIYSVCIIGMFLTGMQMSDWKAVYLHRPPEGKRLEGKPHMLQFAAQFGVGLPALWAIVQNKRFYGDENETQRTLAKAMVADFEGEFTNRAGQPQGLVAGRIQLEPVQTALGGEEIQGRFQGTNADGETVDVALGDHIELSRPISADSRRNLTASVVAEDGRVIGTLHGSISRPVWNWFAAPLDFEQERELHEDLGKFQELAMVFTWVAGLLNLLAIWDAFEGPAYGYGDESTAKQGDQERAESKSSESSDANSAAASVTA